MIQFYNDAIYDDLKGALSYCSDADVKISTEYIVNNYYYDLDRFYYYFIRYNYNENKYMQLVKVEQGIYSVVYVSDVVQNFVDYCVSKFRLNKCIVSKYEY